MKVLNVSDPVSPTLVADIDIDGNALDIKVVGSYAYFAGDLRWSIYEVSDRIHPVWISTYEMSPFVNSIAVANNHAYVAEGMTLHVFDVNDPAHPIRVGGQALNGEIAEIKAVGSTLFVAHGAVSLLDVSDPGRPVLVARHETSAARDIQVVGNYVFVADGQSGLVILGTQPLELPAVTIVRGWPASALGYQLEAKTDLNGTNWSAVADTPQYTGEVFGISMPMLGNRLYRLRRD